MSEFQILGGDNYVPFITNIRAKDLGRTVIIDCTGDPEKTKTYRVFCLECEKVELVFKKNMIDCIYNGVIDIVEFSIMEQPENKKNVYLYGRVVSLDLICENIKVEKDW